MNKISILAALFLAITCYATEQECYIHIPPKDKVPPLTQKKMTEEDMIREGWEKISCDEAEKRGIAKPGFKDGMMKKREDRKAREDQTKKGESKNHK